MRELQMIKFAMIIFLAGHWVIKVLVLFRP